MNVLSGSTTDAAWFRRPIRERRPEELPGFVVLQFILRLGITPRVQYVPGLGVPLIVVAKHRVIGEPALATMFVGFCYYGYISNEGGNPRDKRPDLSLFCLLGLFTKAGRERLQPFCESHVVRGAIPAFQCELK